MQAIGFSHSKKDLVARELRSAILSGQLSPGTRLIIDDLARRLKVSPIPVREALQQLQADGYVLIEPYLGAKVAPIEAESITEVFSLLETMEVVSSKAACRHMSDEDLLMLESIVATMDNLLSDPEQWSQENRRFHQFICERSGTRLIGSLMSKVLDHWDRLHRYFLKDVFAQRLATAQRQHREILRALRARDPVKVELLIRQHNQDSLSAYEKYLRQSAFRGRRTSSSSKSLPASKSLAQATNSVLLKKRE